MALTRAQMDAKLDEHFGFEAADDVEGVPANEAGDISRENVWIDLAAIQRQLA
jgi:hypothetical protein